MLNVTVPFPLPLAPLVMVTHDALSDAVHAQPAGMATEMLPVVAPASTDTPVGERVAVHGTPACVTVNVSPAIVTTPVRGEMLGFAAMLYPTAPFPLPLEPLVTVIHDAELTAVQLQPAAALTETEPVRAPEPTDRLVGEIAKLQPAAWVIVKACPAMVSAPLRMDDVRFAAME
jgi:hypothetical protein